MIIPQTGVPNLCIPVAAAAMNQHVAGGGRQPGWRETWKTKTYIRFHLFPLNSRIWGNTRNVQFFCPNPYGQKILSFWFSRYIYIYASLLVTLVFTFKEEQHRANSKHRKAGHKTHYDAWMGCVGEQKIKQPVSNCGNMCWPVETRPRPASMWSSERNNALFMLKCQRIERHKKPVIC